MAMFGFLRRKAEKVAAGKAEYRANYRRLVGILATRDDLAKGEGQEMEVAMDALGYSDADLTVDAATTKRLASLEPVAATLADRQAASKAAAAEARDSQDNLPDKIKRLHAENAAVQARKVSAQMQVSQAMQAVEELANIKRTAARLFDIPMEDSNRVFLRWGIMGEVMIPNSIPVTHFDSATKNNLGGKVIARHESQNAQEFADLLAAKDAFVRGDAIFIRRRNQRLPDLCNGNRGRIFEEMVESRPPVSVPTYLCWPRGSKTEFAELLNELGDWQYGRGKYKRAEDFAESKAQATARW